MSHLQPTNNLFPAFCFQPSSQQKTSAQIGTSPNISQLNIRKPMWVFPQIGVPQNGWFIRENPIRIDDLEVPLFLETPMWIKPTHRNHHRIPSYKAFKPRMGTRSHPVQKSSNFRRLKRCLKFEKWGINIPPKFNRGELLNFGGVHRVLHHVISCCDNSGRFVVDVQLLHLHNFTNLRKHISISYLVLIAGIVCVCMLVYSTMCLLVSQTECS